MGVQARVNARREMEREVGRDGLRDAVREEVGRLERGEADGTRFVEMLEGFDYLCPLQYFQVSVFGPKLRQLGLQVEGVRGVFLCFAEESLAEKASEELGEFCEQGEMELLPEQFAGFILGPGEG